jgi:amino acid adenylation domain-containing protein/FkbM family methyltransferase
MKTTSNPIGTFDLHSRDRELFDLLLEQDEAAEDPGSPPIVRRNEPLAPLSFAQRRLWFLQQLEPDSPAYNMAGEVHLTGSLSPSALWNSLAEIIRRHETLRTAFHNVDGEGMQVIASVDDFNNTSGKRLPSWVDLSGLDTATGAAAFARLASEQARRPFDLSKAPALRTALVRTSTDEHTLLMTMHHIVSDEWSVTLLVRELGILYRSFSSGLQSALHEPEIQYSDYAQWQRDWFRGQILEDQLGYWETQLRDRPGALDLPTDYPRTTVTSYHGSFASRALSDDLSRSLRALASREGVTPFMFFLGAYAILLSRYTDEYDLLVGVPIAGRDRLEIESLIGFFVNTLVIRIGVPGSASFNEVLESVRDAALDSYAHQDLPFELLVERLQPERDISTSNLFNVAFYLDSTMPGSIDFGDNVVGAIVQNETGASKFDLVLSIVDSEDSIRAAFEYRTDIFAASTIERMLCHLETLLGGIEENPATRISELPLLTADESTQMLVDWNATGAPYPTDKCVHDLFEANSSEVPDRVATVFDGDALSYGTLNKSSNQLAGYLARRGARPESRIGVCAERSLELVVALLAIMKAGGAYVPLDPAYPADRLAFMIDDAGVSLIMADYQSADRLPTQADKLVDLGQYRKSAAFEGDTNETCRITSASPVYVMYTSGSTGQPKGAVLPHRGIVNCLLWLQEQFHIGPHDRVIMKSSLSFDASVIELLWPLMVGSEVIIAAPGGHQDALYLARAISRYRVTVSFFVPSLLRLLLDEPEIQTSGCLRQVLCGGEALPTGTMALFFGQLDAKLLNFYGPTETTVGCVAWRCEPGIDRVPIGRPISNMRGYVLDGSLNALPAGVAGELHTAGDGLALGYLQHPELTAERFLPNPFGPAGTRMYATGDVCKWLSQGDIEFVERADHQVKIRGQRIEPGEIESALGTHPGIRECVVIVSGHRTGDKRLIAYFTGNGQDGVSAENLRSFLEGWLPSHMVPSFFVGLDSLPLMPNGKVDRLALPSFVSVLTESGPRDLDFSPIEELLAGIWESLLPAKPGGKNSDFFELGGHSLMAVQLVSRIREKLGIEVEVQSVFEHPVLSELAQAVETMMDGLGSSLPAIVRSSPGQGVPLSFAQQRLWFLDQLEPDHAIYNVVIAVEIEGQLNVSALKDAISELVRRHDSLRTAFASQGLEQVQVISAPSPVEIALIDIHSGSTRSVGDAVQVLGREGVARPFDLQRGPLLVISLLRVTPEDHTLMVFMHHIISDAWSFGVFVEEFTTLYRAYRGGVASSLPELPIQYADFTIWQRAHLGQDILGEQIEYWRHRLAGAPPFLDLPTDRPRPAVLTYNGGIIEAVLTPRLADRLQEFSRRQSATLYMTLMSAFQTLLYRYSGQRDISVGSPISNRSRKEVEGLIGFFTNTLVIRTEIPDEVTCAGLLGLVREAALGAYAHQDLPFEMLVETLQPVRDLGHSPLFQVMLVLHNAPLKPLRLPGLNIKPLLVDTGKTHFDFTFLLSEEAGEMDAVVEYNSDLFDRSTIARMLRQFEVLLEAIGATPEDKIAGLALLTEAETSQLMIEWNDSGAEFDSGLCVHQLVERQCEVSPDAVAAVFEGDHLTYQALDLLSNRLADYLSGRGVGTDSLAGVCVDRSVEMVIGVLGILKAGAAYVPLDPTYPLERLVYMMDGVSVIVTEPATAGRLPSNGAQEVCLDRHRFASQSGAPQSCPDDGMGTRKLGGGFPESLAYVVYTSGSTGRPKGVAMGHREAVKMICWQRYSSAQSLGGRTLQYASLGFDASFQEIFSTLDTGGTLVLVRDETRKDPIQLLSLIRSEDMERLFLPVAGLQQLADISSEERQFPASLREVITAGEQLKITPRIRGLFDSLPVCKLYNHYGPSETHIATSFELSSEPGEWLDLPSIGRSIENTTVYLTDHSNSPVPVGVAGEVFIGGQGLARGYLNQPDRTAERFVPDPFGRIAGARLYRTGDLARYHGDGIMEFLGRTDHQVKIRGYRVELSEIEVALVEVGGVKEAAVVAGETQFGDKQLTAYVVGDAGGSPSPALIRSLLKQRLPEYMVPATVILLDHMPLTKSGKIDRRALPEPGRVEDIQDLGFAGPRNPVEGIVAQVWAAILGIERAGVAENFFDIGGHSLAATRVISRLRQLFSVELPLRTIFESPTVEGLSASIQAGLKSEPRSVRPPIAAAIRSGPIPLSFAQQRMWFLSRLAPSAAAYHLAGAFTITGEASLDAIEQGLNEIIRRHEVLRTSFKEQDGLPVQIIDSACPMCLIRVDISGEGSRVSGCASKWVRDFVEEPFDLEITPLVRGAVITVAGCQPLLVICMHHIVSDGWSIEILLRELADISQAYRDGVQSALPELDIQYADYGIWQREWLQGQVLEEQLEYWKQALGDKQSTIELPTDRARPAVQSFSGAIMPVSIPRLAARQVRELARSQSCTPYMITLAAFHALLRVYSGQSDISIGTPIANRSSSETEDLIGFFVNTVVIRAGISSHQGFRALLDQIRDRTIAAFANQDIPFEKLVEALEPERDLSRSPLFQVAFALHQGPVTSRPAGGLALDLVEIETRTAKFDLFLSVEDNGVDMAGTFEYNTDLFDSVTVRRMGNHFGRLIANLITDIDAGLSGVSVLSLPEVSQLLLEWNDTEAAFLLQETFPDVFEDQASIRPDCIALVCEDHCVTFDGLNGRANHFARRLTVRGIVPESVVGICLNRSIEMIVALLAALKSGAAYLPLDPTFPVDRLAFMLKNSGASVLITADAAAETGPLYDFPIIRIDSDWPGISAMNDQNLTRQVLPTNLAYIIYTSGSTGIPKGVAVEHKQLMNYVRSIAYRMELPIGSSFAALSTVSADLGNTAIFPSLATGGCLHLVPEHLSLDGERLAEYFCNHPVDCLKIVPSHLAGLMAASEGGGILPQKLLILGGEAASSSLIQPIGARSRRGMPLGPARMNHYGPTETTVGVITYFAGEEEPKGRTNSLPIGCPISNTRGYLLSSDLHPAPMGVAGQIHIGGDSVTRGYVGLPEATADRFIPDPYLDKPGSRLYATGDLGRHLPDGNIEFLGRTDDQIKIRGFRVELKEIEAALGRHPDIREAVVAPLRNAKTAETIGLCAYVTPAPLRARTALGTQRYKLPNNMAVAHLNKNETDYIYKEIFELQAYLRCGITVGPDDVVFDVGANIGLFSLFVKQVAEHASIYAFEPNPEVFRLLKANGVLYAPDARLFEFGLGAERGIAPFTYFPRFSLFSGVHADVETETGVVRQFMLNQDGGSNGGGRLIEEADEILSDRFASKRIDVNLRPLSEVIDDLKIDRIDLLKINAEKSEMEVIAGIREEHWRMIQQVVMEIDLESNREVVSEALDRNGFEMEIIQDELLRGTELCYLYAVKRGSGRHIVRGQSKDQRPVRVKQLAEPFLSAGEVKEFLGVMLPHYMTPSAVVILDAMPITTNGKIDRRRLPDPEQYLRADRPQYVAPGNDIERTIGRAWRDVLGLERISVNDNFFTIGGNSILLAQVCGKLRKSLDHDLSVIDLFRYPTVSSLALHISGAGDRGESTLEAKHRGAERREAAVFRGRRRGV